MNGPMADSALTSPLPDTPHEPEFRPSLRERLGIALFLFVAVVATTTWVAVLVWAIVKLAQKF